MFDENIVMSDMQIVGIVFFALGMMMAVFNRSFGISFCKIGKHIWKDNPFKIPPAFTDFIYDEGKAPRVILFLGVIFAVQGVVFWFLAKP